MRTMAEKRINDDGGMFASVSVVTAEHAMNLKKEVKDE